MTPQPRLSSVRRLRLFIRDYCSEFGIAWSLARSRDCERNGGHPWGEPQDDALMGYSRVCGRCGTTETLRKTSGTGPSISVPINSTYWSGHDPA